MAKGNEIVVASDPKGKFLEGIVSGTPKPGTVMQLTTTVPVGGRHTWVVWAKASGAYGMIAILLADAIQGKIGVGAAATFGSSGGVGGGTYFPPGDAYVTATRCFMYCPFRGEELNMIVSSVAGTTDDVAIGDLFGVETATGKLIANSSYAYPCFTAMEVVTDPSADYMLWCMFS